MITIKNVTLQRGTKILLDDASVSIFDRQRVGLIGANGAGKSSLFSLLLHESRPDGGDVSYPSSLRVSHLSQETPASDKTAIDYVMDGDRGLRQVETELDKAEADGNDLKIAELHIRYADLDGYSAVARAAKLLSGLGFPSETHTNAVKSFSGGWRMRLNLAQALMCPSDLLLLDEPTNHLDLEAIVWLEKWLLSYQGTVVLISHDRQFLDAVTSHIVQLDQKKLVLYTGNYSSFEKQRAEKLALQAASFQKQQKKIAHLESFIRRFKAKASKAKQAQSRMKALDRMEVIGAAQVDSQFSFEFREPLKVPDTLLRLDRVSVGYNNHPVLENIKLTINSDDRIGLLGLNGAGKSTFIKLLAGELPPISGERIETKGLAIGYFAQHQLEQLDPEASPLLHMQRLDRKATEQQLRGFLGSFAFFGDMALAPTRQFSGGEKARLVLAMLVWQKPNLLLLDEPTNHLDLDMRSALDLALQTYEGAVILVSHDRYLLSSTADQFLLVADGRVEEFEGDMDDYQERVRNDATEKVREKSEKKSAGKQKGGAKDPAMLLKNLEKKIDSLKSELHGVEAFLADPINYQPEHAGRLKAKTDHRAQLIKKLEQLEEEWMAVST